MPILGTLRPHQMLVLLVPRLDTNTRDIAVVEVHILKAAEAVGETCPDRAHLRVRKKKA